MRVRSRLLHALPALAALALLGALACQAPDGSGAAEGGDGSRTVARVGDDEITLAELDAWIQQDWLESQVEGKSAAQVHEFRAERLERMIDERLVEAEARSRGVSPEQLLRQEAAGARVSDAEVRAFFDSNQQRMGDTPFEQIAPRIRRHLQQRRAQEELRGFVAELRDREGVQVSFEPPRVEVAAEGPALGPEDAPVTIVEFSDFQCPYCSRAAPVVKQLHDRYPEQVRIVYRHFPLDSIHPRARPAAEASLCAAEQGGFWEYHDALFANADQLADADLVAYAEQLGLDTGAFRACFEEGRYRDQVERDLQAGRAAGVSGTPSFFVNGRMLGGAQPLEEFVTVIESELEAEAGPAEAAAGDPAAS